MTLINYSGTILLINNRRGEHTLKKITADTAPKAIGAYSQAIACNGLLYTSGQIPIDPETGAFNGDNISEQTEQVIKNIGEILKAAGATFKSVIKTTCFLADMNDFAVFNAIYAKYFVEKPARSCVAVLDLPKGALVEIEVVALIEK